MAVLDDASHFRRICAQLAACPGQQANEAELKVGGEGSAAGGEGSAAAASRLRYYACSLARACPTAPAPPRRPTLPPWRRRCWASEGRAATACGAASSRRW